MRRPAIHRGPSARCTGGARLGCDTADPYNAAAARTSPAALRPLEPPRPTLPILLAALLVGCADDPAPEKKKKERKPRPTQGGGDAPTAATATYTSLARSGCKTREEGELDAQIVVIQCRGQGGYGVRVEAHDHGSELDLTQKGRALGLRYESPGWMANVTDGKIEWRARGDAPPHALIFRVKWVDGGGGTNQERSTLVVARLDGDEVCEVGQTGSNAQAREIADDRSKRCR